MFTATLFALVLGAAPQPAKPPQAPPVKETCEKPPQAPPVKDTGPSKPAQAPPVQGPGAYEEAWKQVRAGKKVLLGVGVVAGEYAVERLDGFAPGVYECFLRADGTAV